MFFVRVFFLLSFVGAGSFYGIEPSSYPYDEFETSATRPNLPANRILNSTLNTARKAQSEKEPVASGDFLDTLNLGIDYIYTDFDDKVFQGDGDVEEAVFSLSGLLSENTLLSFSYSNIAYHYTSPSPDFEIQAHGYDLAIHHSVNENYGFGGYTFYQDIDIQNENSNSFTYGVGGLFTTYHDLDIAVLSTSSSLSWVDFDYGYDSVFLMMVDLSRQLTDWCTVGINASWTDSLRSNNEFDNNYWLLGAELRFNLDNWMLSVGYERTEQLDNYEGDSLSVSLDYFF